MAVYGVRIFMEKIQKYEKNVIKWEYYVTIINFINIVFDLSLITGHQTSHFSQLYSYPTSFFLKMIEIEIERKVVFKETAERLERLG